MKEAFLRAIGSALDDLGIGLCAVDGEDREIFSNATFLRLFPQHQATSKPGTPVPKGFLEAFANLPLSERVVQIDLHTSDLDTRDQAPGAAQTQEWRRSGDSLRTFKFALPGGGRVQLCREEHQSPADASGKAGHPPLERAETFKVFELLSDGVVFLDHEGLIRWANRAFLRMYSVASLPEAQGVSMQQVLLHAWKAFQLAERDARSLGGNGIDGCGTPFEVWLPPHRRIRVSQILCQGEPRGRYLIHTDLTAYGLLQEAMNEAENRYRLMAHYSNDIMLFVADGIVAYASPAITELLGWDPLAVLGWPVIQLCHPDDVVAVTSLLRSLRGRQETNYQARALHRSGHYVWIEARARRLPTAVAGGRSRYVINARGIQARKAVEDELRNVQQRLLDLAMTDGLTGLANRRRLDEALDVEMRRAQREGSNLALLVLDIDRFKLLNDSHGHQVGDAVLRRLGEILMSFPNRAGDLAARFGGEEFVLLLPGANEQQALVVAERLRRTVQATDFDPPVHVSVTVSIGVACLESARTVSPERLVGLADGALYQAKKNGRNRVVAA